MKRVDDPQHARFLTFSTYQNLELFGNAAVRDAFVEQLRLTRERHRFLLYAWVLMPNHAHLLVREPESGDVVGILRTLKLGLAKRVLDRRVEIESPILERLVDARGVRRFWQRGGGYDRNVFSRSEFDEKVGYIHLNPVRAGLVERATDWAWGSARWWDGRREGEVACDGWGDGGRPA